MGGIRQQVAGGASPAKRQFEDEVLRTTPEVRCQILKNAKICQETVSPEEVLAMKADLSIPWNKLRHLRRLVHIYVYYK